MTCYEANTQRFNSKEQLSLKYLTVSYMPLLEKGYRFVSFHHTKKSTSLPIVALANHTAILHRSCYRPLPDPIIGPWQISSNNVPV